MTFTKSNEEKFLQFEKEIAYFYGAKNPERIAPYYLDALKRFEKLRLKASKNALVKTMITPLKKAYAEVHKQTSLIFDIDAAARLELNLIFAQAQEESFEHIYHIMLELYTIVFGSNAPSLHKGALLRTFLYKYKISTLKIQKVLSEEDIDLLLAIAKASEKELEKGISTTK